MTFSGGAPRTSSHASRDAPPEQRRFATIDGRSDARRGPSERCVGASVRRQVHERFHEVKHQQLVSGVSLSAYWLSAFLWDMLLYVPPFAVGWGVMVRSVRDATGRKPCRAGAKSDGLHACAVRKQRWT